MSLWHFYSPLHFFYCTYFEWDFIIPPLTVRRVVRYLEDNRYSYVWWNKMQFFYVESQRIENWVEVATVLNSDNCCAWELIMVWYNFLSYLLHYFTTFYICSDILWFDMNKLTFYRTMVMMSWGLHVVYWKNSITLWMWVLVMNVLCTFSFRFYLFTSLLQHRNSLLV